MVLIFNYTWKNASSSLFRKGAENEGHELQNFYHNLGYEVVLHEDRTKDQTMTLLENAAQFHLKRKKSLILFILGHGEGCMTNSHFYTFDKLTILLREILQILSESSGSAIDGIPKKIFLNYCRQNRKDAYQSDVKASWNSESSSDLSIFQANYLAPIEVDGGTIFVKSLLETMSEKSNILNFRDLIIQLQNRMRKYGALQVFY